MNSASKMTIFSTMISVPERQARWSYCAPLFFALLSFFLAACHQAHEPIVIHGKTMGTYFRVTLAVPDRAVEVDALRGEIEHALDTVNRSMSTYIADSELMRFNATDTTEPVAISAGLRQVIKKALTIADQSNGYYDITIGPLVELWGFGKKQVSRAPNQAEIETALKRVGYRYLKLSPAGLAKARWDVSLDLSSIAKGYGVDRVAELLETKGYRNYLVDIGGELRVAGQRFGKPWRIGIEAPDSQIEAVQSVIAIPRSQLAMATSGNYRNYRDYDGVHAVHIIDPKTGGFRLSRLLSVTVLGDKCMTADAYATALMAMGEGKAARFAEKYRLPVLFIYAGERPGAFRVRTSSRYAAFIRGEST